MPTIKQLDSHSLWY